MSARKIARWVLGAGVVCLAFYWYPASWLGHDFITALYDAMAASLIAISLTVLLIDNANEQRDTRQLKKRLLWEMGSSDQAFAIRAAKELRDAKWLFDGSLKAVDLTLANLQRAQLAGAFLEEVILVKANLSWANLEAANLQRANLEDITAERLNARKAQIQGAILRGAKLPNAVLEEIDGASGVDLLGASLIRASLRGANLKGAQLEECDFFEADMTGIDLTSATLLRANVAGAILTNANLERADLSELEGWSSIRSIEGARISGVRNAPDGFRAWAVEHGAVDSTSVREATSFSSTEESLQSSGESQTPNAATDETTSLSVMGEDVQLQVGDRVRHNTFGTGVVLSTGRTERGLEYKIRFDDEAHGTKTILPRYAPMIKLLREGSYADSFVPTVTRLAIGIVHVFLNHPSLSCRRRILANGCWV
jgi:uncharacterized protein YjbI with pentapeptide repeats